MAYRYIFQLLGSVTDMYTARKARTGDGEPTRRRAGGRSSPPRRARCSARRTRCPRRSTWRWSRAATAATPGTLHAFRLRALDVDCVARRRSSVRCSRPRSRPCALTTDLLVVRDVQLRLPRPLRGARRRVADRRARARGSRCSARTGAASRRCSRSSTACSSPTRAPPRVRPAGHRGRTSRTSSSTVGSARRVGFVFQNSDAQVFSPTVREEIAFGPLHDGLAARRGRGARRRRARAARDRRSSPTGPRTSCRAARRSGSRSPRCSS